MALMEMIAVVPHIMGINNLISWNISMVICKSNQDNEVRITPK